MIELITNNITEIIHNIKKNAEEIIDDIDDNTRTCIDFIDDSFFCISKSICKPIYELHTVITGADF